MQTEYLLNAINRYFTTTEGGIIPFSNGTSSRMWYCQNCDSCIKAITSRVKDYCYEEDADEVVLSGRDCPGNYAIGFGFISGEIPKEIAVWMNAKIHEGEKYCTLPAQCMYFSDDENDNPDLPPQPPFDPNQLLIPFDITDLFGFDDPDIVVTKKAILEINY